MTYPPGSPGYPPSQQPTTQFSAPTQQFGKLPDPAAAAEGPSKLPMYLTIAVAALGLAAYVSSYGPLFSASSSTELFTPMLLNLGVVAALLAALIAGASLLPKQRSAPAPLAVLSVLGFLLVLVIVLTVPDGISIDWGLYLLVAFSLVQAIAAVAVLLFDAGIITPPAPRPRYEQQQQYGQYGGPGPYYGQPHQPGPPQQQHQQRPGYPSPYGGGYAGGPASGHYQGQPAGAPTPPTGFPAYGQPPSTNAQSGDASSSHAPTTQVPTTQSPAQPSSSNHPGPPPS
ncbi:MAG: hypothetical protein NVS4B6_20610 [Mycobacterium sp.]